MRKLKLYLDTSAISVLDAHESPDRQADSLKLWDDIINGEYDVYTSYVAFNELGYCSDEKRDTLTSYLAQIEYTLIDYSDEIIALADEFVKLDILKQKSHDDAQHIAAAMVAGCDIIASWNFKHMVNHKTIRGVKIVSAMTKYRDVSIYTPTMLIGDDDDT